MREQLEKLAAFEPQELPVLSLYLNLAADQHGRDQYDAFVRKVFGERQKAFKENTPARSSFDRDVERIQTYLSDDVNRSAHGLALFACYGANEYFEAVQLQVPVEEHWLFVGPAPHLYPLVKLAEQYPRYAAVVLDTNQARIVVFGLGEVERKAAVNNVKTRRSSMGGWSQARYQRRAENFHLHHVKEVVETLDKIVSAENIQHIVIAGDDVVVPLVKEQLPQRLLDKLADSVRMEKDAPEDEVLRGTLEALRQKDAESDIECVQEVVGSWQGSGLGTVGPEAVLNALQLGQVDELLITGVPAVLKPVQNMETSMAGNVTADTSAPSGPEESEKIRLASELVTRAQQTGARVRIIEDPSLLSDFGGAAARLRFRV